MHSSNILEYGFGRFTNAIVGVKYQKSQGDHTFFLKHSTLGMVTAPIVYENDIIVTRNYLEEIEWLKKILAAKLK